MLQLTEYAKDDFDNKTDNDPSGLDFILPRNYQLTKTGGSYLWKMKSYTQCGTA